MDENPSVDGSPWNHETQISISRKTCLGVSDSRPVPDVAVVKVTGGGDTKKKGSRGQNGERETFHRRNSAKKQGCYEKAQRPAQSDTGHGHGAILWLTRFCRDDPTVILTSAGFSTAGVACQVGHDDPLSNLC